MRQQGEQDPEQHRREDPRQHPQDAPRKRQPELGAAGELRELARDLQRRGEQQLLFQQRGGKLPEQQPEQDDGERPQRFTPLDPHPAI